MLKWGCEVLRIGLGMCQINKIIKWHTRNWQVKIQFRH